MRGCAGGQGGLSELLFKKKHQEQGQGEWLMEEEVLETGQRLEETSQLSSCIPQVSTGQGCSPGRRGWAGVRGAHPELRAQQGLGLLGV